MLHKENVNPDRQPNAVIAASDSAVKYQVLSSVSSPIVSALCSKQPSYYPSGDAQQAPSPRVLQLSNRQASAGSPSAVARQRLIDEKRALLARLRAEKQELRQRIKEDNEKVIVKYQTFKQQPMLFILVRIHCKKLCIFSIDLSQFCSFKFLLKPEGNCLSIISFTINESVSFK